MQRFDHIAIIYNPHSTGDASGMANELAERIAEYNDEIGTVATLTPTKHARHAHTLAKEISLQHQRPLIVSVSGDGGYNEVINGIMEAKQSSSAVNSVTAVVAAGNANDHKRMTRGDVDLISLILRNEPKSLDVLELDTADGSIHRFAHSYIGLGISPQIGYELNKHGKNTVIEAVTLLKTFWKFEPFMIEHNEKTLLLDSLVFANISEMAKVLKLEPETDVTNNRFRVVEFHHRSKVRLVADVLRSIFSSIKSQYHTDSYTFTTNTKELVQFDGEVETIPADTTVTVRSVPGALQSLYEV